jgi:hypothetical protein
MSVTLTEAAVVTRQKTVTRRMGWRNLDVGEHLTLCRKVMGRKRKDGTVEPLVRLAEVFVWSVFPVVLEEITPADVVREGFPDWTPEQFVRFFCEHMKCQPTAIVNRIEWRYLPEVSSANAAA